MGWGWLEFGRGIASVPDKQSLDLNDGASVALAEPAPFDARQLIPRPPLPAVPRMLPAIGTNKPPVPVPAAAKPLPVLPSSPAVVPFIPLPSFVEAPPALPLLIPPPLLSPPSAPLPSPPSAPLLSPPSAPLLSPPSAPLLWPDALPPPLPAPVVAAPLPAPPRYRPAVPATPRLDLRQAARLARRALRIAVLACAAYFIAVVVLTVLLRFINPPLSMLMLTQRLTGQRIEHAWVPLSAISPQLRRAVITSEDGKFCRHWGFDVGEIRAAMTRENGFGRGASTITQQVAKNLFLWPGKSYVRKALEIPVTLVIEAIWPKPRIFEVYLNIAEWGPGVFGAEAAAQYYYSHSAARLSEREAALLAVALPNPIARDASDPDPGVSRRASRLQTRMRLPGTRACVLTAPPGEREP